MEAATLPAGFQPHYRASPLTEPWEPLYSRRTEGAVILGVETRAAHTNSRGFVHGGFISALADAAMGLSCGQKLEGAASLVTVSLTLDFLATARVGQWLEFDTIFVKPGGSLCFAQAFVTADGEPCARANAVFKVVRKVN